MTLRFRTRLYPLYAIESAVKAYAGLAEIKVQGGRGAWHRVSFDRIAPEVKERLADEFANHVLSEIKL